MRALVVRPGEAAAQESLTFEQAREVVGGDVAQHHSPIWRELGVVCLVLEEGWPFWSETPRAPANVALPTVVTPDGLGVEPIYGPIVFFGDGGAELIDVPERVVAALKRLLAKLPTVSQRFHRPTLRIELENGAVIELPEDEVPRG